MCDNHDATADPGDEDSEPVAACERCGAGLAPDSGEVLCGPCLWEAVTEAWDYELQVRGDYFSGIGRVE
jgi:hypothetical protein